MEWQQLIGFYQLAKLGSFTQAANASFRTQSALSQQIKKLEDEFQCLLIDRTNRKRFVLTPAGERLYRFAESVISEYVRLSDDISSIRGKPQGRLTIAAPFTTLYHLFPERFRSYLQAYPYVELTILDRPQKLALEMLKAGEIDLAVALESNVPNTLSSRRWKQVETVLVVPYGHPLLKIREIGPSDIAGYPLILPPGSLESRKTIVELFSREDLEYRVIMESGNVELSSRFVEAGIGIAFASIVSGMRPPKSSKIRFLQLTRYFGADYIAVVFRKGRPLPLHTENFISRLLGRSPDMVSANRAMG